MYRINSTWTSFSVDLQNLKQVLLNNQYPLRVIDVMKKYLQNAINKTNTERLSGEIPITETRYFKLPFIGMYSTVTQNKVEKPCKRFCKNAKVKLVFTIDKLHQTILIHMFSVQRLLINLFLLAVMLVIFNKCTNISQPELMNTLARTKSHIYTNT